MFTGSSYMHPGVCNNVVLLYLSYVPSFGMNMSKSKMVSKFMSDFHRSFLEEW